MVLGGHLVLTWVWGTAGPRTMSPGDNEIFGGGDYDTDIAVRFNHRTTCNTMIIMTHAPFVPIHTLFAVTFGEPLRCSACCLCLERRRRWPSLNSKCSTPSRAKGWGSIIPEEPEVRQRDVINYSLAHVTRTRNANSEARSRARVAGQGTKRRC